MRKKALEISFKQKCALEFFDVLAAMLLCFLACDNLALNWFANYPNTAKVCAVRSGCSHVRATPLSCCKNLLSLLKKQTNSQLSKYTTNSDDDDNILNACTDEAKVTLSEFICCHVCGTVQRGLCRFVI